MRELDVACDLARRAGDVILDVLEQGFDVEHKEGREPVTEADRRADALIRRGLVEAFPGDGLLSEESPDDLERLAKRRLWLVDPLDGTKQFVARIPEFAVMIGLAVEGQAALGVVHLPAEGLTLAAARGEGCALIDGEGARRALELDPGVPEGPLVVAVSRSIEGTRTARALAALDDAKPLPSGSVGRKAALVARGEADAYFSLSTRSRHWDACAAEAIVREAGGVFRDARAQRLIYNTPEIRNMGGLLACRRGLLDELARGLAPFTAAAPPERA